MGNKNVFWQALIFTLIVFAIGLLLGFYLETSREGDVGAAIINSEINLLDDQLLAEIISDFDVECEVAINRTFNFADRIYYEALKLEDFDDATKFNRDDFFVLHRRYDLLRAFLWTKSIDLRERCGKDFHTVVYLYDFRSEDVDVRSKQIFFSNLLADLKSRYPNDIILIPIAANTELASLDLLKEIYGIEVLPSVIIDERLILTDIITLEELENYIINGNVSRV